MLRLEVFYVSWLEVTPADPGAYSGGKDREQEADQDRRFEAPGKDDIQDEHIQCQYTLAKGLRNEDTEDQPKECAERHA